MISHLGKVLIIDSTSFESLEQISLDFWNTVNAIYLPNDAFFKLHINKIIEEHNLQCYINENSKLRNEILFTGIIAENPENIPQLKKEFPKKKIGVLTPNLVDCKNAELMKADFVWLGPFNDVGIELYEDLTPLEMPYEWMILNIVIPVFVYGSLSNQNLQLLKDKIELGGIVSNFESLENSNKIAFEFKL